MLRNILMANKKDKGLIMATTKRKFKKVPKTKGGVPKKYVSGAKNPKAREA